MKAARKGEAKLYNVVVVDDNAWILDDIIQTFDFSAHGISVMGKFLSAQEALPVILQQKPELVITDIRMGKMSGLDLVHTCREKKLKTLFIILSGYDRFDYAQAAVRENVFEYLLKPIDDAKVQELMQRILARLQELFPPQPQESGASKDSFAQVLHYIDQHYNEPISLNDIAEIAFLNKTYLSQLFTRRLGISFTRYRNNLRIKKACQLIQQGSKSMTDIAFETGFESLSRFSKVFRQIEGISPQQYRAAVLKTIDENLSPIEEEV